MARPYHGYHRLIHQKAAALVHAVVSNHGFADGNKRTALYLVELLVQRSGYVCLHGTAALVLAHSLEVPSADSQLLTLEAFEGFCARFPMLSKSRSGPANGGGQAAALVDADGAATPEGRSGREGSGARAGRLRER